MITDQFMAQLQEGEGCMCIELYLPKLLRRQIFFANVTNVF